MECELPHPGIPNSFVSPKQIRELVIMSDFMKTFSLLSIVCVLGIPNVSAYTNISVEDGGAIVGQVAMQGPKPDPLAYNLALFPDPAFCGQISTGTGWRLYDHFQVSPDGALKNAIVILEGIHQGKPFEIPEATVEAKDCIFLPSVMAVRNKQEIRFFNMDPVVHDVQM